MNPNDTPRRMRGSQASSSNATPAITPRVTPRGQGGQGPYIPQVPLGRIANLGYQARQSSRNTTPRPMQPTPREENVSARGAGGGDDEPVSWLKGVQSPTQPTVELHWCMFILRVAFMMMFYFVIISTIPVGDVSISVNGVNRFVDNIQFDRLSGDRAKLDNVATLDDVALFSQSFVNALLTEKSYAGLREDDEHLMLLRVHRLLNAIVFKQVRVEDTDCSYPSLRHLYEKCYETIDGHMTTAEFNGISYDQNLGGHAVHIPLDKDKAKSEVLDLMDSRFWDRGTREFTIGFAFHNAPGHFTGFSNVLFTISPYGMVNPSVETTFLRLQPYSKETNGEGLLTLQAICLTFLLAFLMELVYGACNQPHIRWSLAYVLRPWALFDFIFFAVIITGVIEWVRYLQNPMRLEFDPLYPKFQNIGVLAEQFQLITLCLAMGLLLCVIRTIEYFVVIPQLAFLYGVLAKAVASLGWFFIIFLTLFVGFCLSGHVLFGTTVSIFGDPISSASHLSLWFLTLGGGHEELFDKPGGSLFLTLFMLICMVLLFNMFIGIVMAAYEGVHPDGTSTEDDGDPYNHTLADFICDRIGISPYKGKMRTSPYTEVSQASESETLDGAI